MGQLHPKYKFKYLFYSSSSAVWELLGAFSDSLRYSKSLKGHSLTLICQQNNNKKRILNLQSSDYCSGKYMQMSVHI